jgi:hypothetical protein
VLEIAWAAQDGFLTPDACDLVNLVVPFTPEYRQHRADLTHIDGVTLLLGGAMTAGRIACFSASVPAFMTDSNRFWPKERLEPHRSSLLEWIGRATFGAVCHRRRHD